MTDWRRVNQRIAAAKATRDPVAALRRLFEAENDGHVAMALGRQFRVDGDLTQAAHWFERAEALYPLERFRAEARQARLALTPASSNVTGGSKVQACDTLHIISCSRQKAWDDPRIVAAYLPAQEAYRGAEITAWREKPESRTERWLFLSAKYGFIEPDHPIAPYDVTYNDLATGPISDATLRAQVEHQMRWADRLPLRAFRRVVVHGPSTYVAKVKAAFASTGAEIATPGAGGDITGGTALESMTGTVVIGRAREIGAALGALPAVVYERLDCGEPEWPVIKALAAQPHPWGVMCTLALGLCDYQLGAGGADAYWAGIAQLLGRRSVKSSDDVLGFVTELVTLPVSKRLANQKLDRVTRLLSSDLSDRCSRTPLDDIGRHGDKLWSRLATVMLQSADAKTIVFAMKCFDLLHKAKTGRYASFGDIPIIVDLRIARLSLTSGLLVLPVSMERALQEATAVATANHGALIEGWNAVRSAAGGLSLLRIDSLVWQLARPIYEHHQTPMQAAAQAVSLLRRAGADGEVAELVGRELTVALSPEQP